MSLKNTDSRGECPKLQMKISMNVLEHLGLKMYTSLPAVIAEYVANCWDAGATLVEITIPKGRVTKKYAITIKDNGEGMTAEEVNRKFLVVGRSRRVEEGTDEIIVKGKKRRVMGSKGLGKLAGFGVAGQVEMFVIKDGKFVAFRMDYDKIQKGLSKAEEKDVVTEYSPDVLDWGLTTQSEGTVAKLTRLKRKRAVRIHHIRRNLARHFSIIGSDFTVQVNGSPLKPVERELREICEYGWDIEDEYIDKEAGLKINGWIGTMWPKKVPRDIESGIVVMARGKLVQTPTTFDIGGKGITGQHALTYLVGEIHAEFLDLKEDLIATGRRSVLWEKEPALKLRDWANKKVREVCKEWAEKRREKKMKRVKELPTYKERISNLPKREKKIVDSFLAKMAEREDVELETIERTADFLATGVEYDAFLDLIDTVVDAQVAKPEVLIEFFKEWEVLDAIEMVRVVEGRLNAIRKFQELVRIRAKEVPTLHNFLVDNPWLLDPTWDYLDDEVDFRNKLLKRFPEAKDVPEENRRIDFLCLGYGNTLNVIELKRPESSIGRKELGQLEDYVDYVRPLQGTDPTSYQTVVGYIIGGRLVKTREVAEKAARLRQSSMYVRTYNDLQRRVLGVHKRFIEVLERKAIRISDKRLLEGLGRLKVGFEEAKVLAQQK